MEYIEQLLYHISHFHFNGIWWQYFIALAILVVITAIATDRIRKIPVQILISCIVLILILGAWSLVELIEMGKTWVGAITEVGLICIVLCGPIYYTIIYLEETQDQDFTGE